MQLTQDQQFENIDFTIESIPKGEFENCTFLNCNFSNLDLSNFIFIDCVFTDANLSLVKLNNTIFRDIQFKGCKMIGLQFGDAYAFGLSMSFDACILTNASFYKAKIKKTKFINSKLIEVDFTETDLSESVFTNCDFTAAIFSNTNIERADLMTSFNYSIDIEKNKIKKSKHSVHQLAGLLDKYQIKIE
jgi:uncharacterized protein YjbI with pentapeptide repeats